MCSIFEHFLEEATLEGVRHKLIFCDFSVSVRVDCFPVRIWTGEKSRGSKKGAKDMTYSLARQNSLAIFQVLKPDVCYTSCHQIFVLLDLSHSEQVDNNVPWCKKLWIGYFFWLFFLQALIPDFSIVNGSSTVFVKCIENPNKFVLDNSQAKAESQNFWGKLFRIKWDFLFWSVGKIYLWARKCSLARQDIAAPEDIIVKTYNYYES